jgi:non-ribosomal peptide synthetase component F
VWEPAGVKVVEIYYDNRGFLRDPKGRLVEVAGMDVAAKFRTAPADVYMCLGHVAERADSVRIECIAPPYEAARAMWALERAKLCVAEKQDIDSLIDTVKRYEAEINACRSELEELKKVKR